eukprot:COSAG01_NODE_52889_length_343_cov_0.852459_2_plen_23_part_01
MGKPVATYHTVMVGIHLLEADWW